MARFTVALGVKSGETTQRISVEHRLVNLHRDENVAEWYLLSINSKGQVPAMKIDLLPTLLTDSRDISYWFCDIYPRLLPGKHRSRIQELLVNLHSIEALSLSASRPEQPEEDVVNPACDTLLAKEDISNQYREALQHKKLVDESHMLKALHHESIARAEEQARALLAEVAGEHQLHRDGSTWLFGEAIGPTVLDAHIVPFITRLDESGHSDLLPEELLQYAQRVRSLPEWDQVMHGRRTRWGVEYGHIHLLPAI